MTEPYYLDPTVTLHHGDCLDVLRGLPDASADAVVTDPPYGLEFMGKEWDAPWKASEVTRAQGRDAAGLPIGAGSGRGTSPTQDRPRFGLSPTALVGFQAWCQLWATECLRVLKPGGHLLAFGGTRTSHRLACAIEDAGFEIRDSIAWLYGSGFPKSLDVSKAIDKRRDDRAEVQSVCRILRDTWENNPRPRREIDQHFGTKNVGGHWFTPDSPLAQCPTWDQYLWLKDWLGMSDELDADVWRLNGRKGKPGANYEAREVLSERETSFLARTKADGSRIGGDMLMASDRGTSTIRVTAPATPDAERWQGWGTALKPAHEPVVVARKPLTGTVAQTVLQHGTGALNIDGCRVDGAGAEAGRTRHGGGRYTPVPDSDPTAATFGRLNPDVRPASPAGRWPANVVLDESQAAALDQQSGETVSTSRPRHNTAEAHNRTVSMGGTNADWTTGGHDDLGGASRFFYTAKAATDERVRIDGIAHPTVKPLSLMRWLVRLVTPPGGTVLEPFAGSGTTVEACILEGFRCIAIEREADYLPLIKQRIHRRRDPVQAVKATGEDGGLFDLLGEETA